MLLSNCVEEEAIPALWCSPSLPAFLPSLLHHGIYKSLLAGSWEAAANDSFALEERKSPFNPACCCLSYNKTGEQIKTTCQLSQEIWSQLQQETLCQTHNTFRLRMSVPWSQCFDGMPLTLHSFKGSLRSIREESADFLNGKIKNIACLFQSTRDDPINTLTYEKLREWGEREIEKHHAV